MPEWIATARINQPWGHLQIGGVIRNDRLNDGQYLNQSMVGYGGTVSGDVHPFSGAPGPLGKDDIGFGLCIGNGMGNQCANGSGMATSFGRSIFVAANPALGVPAGFVNPLTSAQWNTNNSATRKLYDGLVSTQTVPSQAGWFWVQHWWTDNLRSTAAISGIYNDINTSITGIQATPSNKTLTMANINLFWSPVAFIDFGTEYAWGHRVVTSNFKGDAYTIEGLMRVRF
jgi:hypothetical protein